MKDKKIQNTAEVFILFIKNKLDLYEKPRDNIYFNCSEKPSEEILQFMNDTV